MQKDKHRLNIQKLKSMLKNFAPAILSVGTFGVSLITFGTVVSIMAGMFSIVYTAMKMYDWIRKERGKK